MAGKVKNPNRVAAGKKAWGKLAKSEQDRRISALKAGQKGPKSSPKPTSPRGSTMASNKSNNNNGGRQKQGVTSWLTSVIAVCIAFSSDAARVAEARWAPKGQRLLRWLELEFSDYSGYHPGWTGIDGEPHWVPYNLMRGYGTKAAAVAFKKSSSYVVKTCPIKSLIPRLS